MQKKEGWMEMSPADMKRKTQEIKERYGYDSNGERSTEHRPPYSPSPKVPRIIMKRRRVLETR